MAYIGLDWEKHVRIDRFYFRPTEVNYLQADAIRARELFNWQPKVRFNKLVRIMVDADMVKIELASPGEDQQILNSSFGGWHRWEDQVISINGY